jgi:hypothetical protein
MPASSFSGNFLPLSSMFIGLWIRST